MILIVTVNYNNAAITNQMIENIASLTETDEIQVIVVDNNSNDKSELKENDFTKVIYLPENIGYFPALNKGIESQNIKQYDYVIICNNDLTFEKNFFSLLQKKKYIEKVFSISPRILDMDGIDQNPVFEKCASSFKLFFYTLYYSNYYLGKLLYNTWQLIKPKSKIESGKSHVIFQGYGAIYILTRNFFTKNTVLDCPPFLMEEEAFLGFQIDNSGGLQYYDKELIVHHKEHSSCKNIPSKKIYHYSKESYKQSKIKQKKQKTITDFELNLACEID